MGGQSDLLFVVVSSTTIQPPYDVSWKTCFTWGDVLNFFNSCNRVCILDFESESS